MAKRRAVVHVSSGEVFATAAEAERKFHLPSSVLSECIRLGKPCHGEVFRYADDVPAAEATEVATAPSDATSSPEDIVSDVYEKLPILFDSTRGDIDTSYKGSSGDKEYAVRYFSDKGYDVEDVGGVLMFYGSDLNDVYHAVLSSGYRASWGVSYRSSEQES